MEDANWQNAFELTLLSAVRLIRLALPRMRAGGGGSIVCITSSSVRQPIPGLIASNVMRAGVASLVKSLSREFAPDGIRVNNVIPGRLDTDRVRELDIIRAGGGDPSEIRRLAEKRIPLGRYGDPRELGNAVAFLCSDQASYITGAALQIDGGMIEALP
jgi:3-oxoacyl-[acyl-carrier protein] reductase